MLVLKLKKSPLASACQFACIIDSHATVTFASARDYQELNSFRSVIVGGVLQSIGRFEELLPNESIGAEALEPSFKPYQDPARMRYYFLHYRENWE